MKAGPVHVSTAGRGGGTHTRTVLYIFVASICMLLLYLGSEYSSLSARYDAAAARADSAYSSLSARYDAAVARGDAAVARGRPVRSRLCASVASVKWHILSFTWRVCRSWISITITSNIILWAGAAQHGRGAAVQRQPRRSNGNSVLCCRPRGPSSARS